MLFFFFQAEDGIRDHCVTGVQTCALPILDDVVTSYRSFTQCAAIRTVARHLSKVGLCVERNAASGERRTGPTRFRGWGRRGPLRYEPHGTKRWNRNDVRCPGAVG